MQGILHIIHVADVPAGAVHIAADTLRYTVTHKGDLDIREATVGSAQNQLIQLVDFQGFFVGTAPAVHFLPLCHISSYGIHFLLCQGICLP